MAHERMTPAGLFRSQVNDVGIKLGAGDVRDNVGIRNVLCEGISTIVQLVEATTAVLIKKPRLEFVVWPGSVGLV